MSKKKTKRMVEDTIRVLRFITGGQGNAVISVFDAGAGGGFNLGHVQIFLERDGQTLDKHVNTPKELRELILTCVYHGFDDKSLADKILSNGQWDN